MSSLGQAILQTVAYFDLFDYPLTSLEVWRFLYAPGMGAQEFEKIFNELNALVEEKKLEYKNGFYTLPGRTAIIEVRAERYTLSFSKYRRARRVAALLSWFPGVRLVCLANTMAWRHSRAGSDIDFFIITAAGRIWSTRLIAVAPIAALGLRPKKDLQSADAVCLSFFAAENALNLRSLMIADDIYLPYWIASLVPLASAPGVFEKFKEQNAWVREYLPNITFREPAQEIKKISKTSLCKLPMFFENFSKRMQMRSFPDNIRERAGDESTDVVVSENYLKFHTEDRRSEFRDAWRAKVRELI